MQIPAQPASTADAAALRRDVQPSAPTSPVAGVAEEAQNIDPRVALKWAQPVFKGESVQLMRDAAASALAPAGAAAYPQLSALATLLGPWMAQAEAQLSQGVSPSWPNPGPEDGPPPAADLPPRAAVHQALGRLMAALGRQEAFAASRLAHAWWLQPQQGASDAQTEQQARWVAALNPGSEGAQQAARLLLTGQMVWEGQLLPDLPVRILRQDAWRGGPEQEQPLEKGASLSLEVDLPGLGPLRVLAQQWGQELQLSVVLPQQSERLRQRWGLLQSRLDALQVLGLQLREITPESLGEAHGI